MIKLTLSVRGGKADVGPHRLAKIRKPETGVHLGAFSFQVQKSPTIDLAKNGEIVPTFQRAFLNWECTSSIFLRSAKQSLNLKIVVK